MFERMESKEARSYVQVAKHRNDNKLYSSERTSVIFTFDIYQIFIARFSLLFLSSATKCRIKISMNNSVMYLRSRARPRTRFQRIGSLHTFHVSNSNLEAGRLRGVLNPFNYTEMPSRYQGYVRLYPSTG